MDIGQGPDERDWDESESKENQGPLRRECAYMHGRQVCKAHDKRLQLPPLQRNGRGRMCEFRDETEALIKTPGSTLLCTLRPQMHDPGVLSVTLGKNRSDLSAESPTEEAIGALEVTGVVCRRK
mmetsp:Transcript_33981/g.45932  ORF Transcript_33981/g.45932 Transcript_33981/m.45932 type:complete len:124 (+) Transcript_33981:182-553(+)